MPTKRDLDWAGTSKGDIRGFPQEVRSQLAYAFLRAQDGKTHPDAKLVKGFGGTSVMEVVIDHDGDTFRGAYTTKFTGPIWVLRCFKKKPKKGRATPKSDVDLIKSPTARLGTAAQKLGARGGFHVKRGSRNVFADVGLPEPNALLAKAELTSKIADVIEALHLTQSEAAERSGVPQPKLSGLLRGRFQGFSMEKLCHILTTLGCDVDIKVSPRAARYHQARLLVIS